ncbi:MAG: carbohydrate ABC transporter permease [Parvibaculaceae bacterium]
MRADVERRRNSGSRLLRVQGASAYLFLLPWLVGFFGLTLGPMVASLYLSFTDYSLVQSPHWIGADNYIEMFSSDRRFWKSLSVTCFYVLLSVPAKLVFALAIAVMLDKGIRGLPLYRAVFYLPSLLGASVAIAVMWRQVFGIDGLANEFLSLFGVQGPSWITNPRTSIYTLVLLSVWQFGSPMIIFLAGLRQIPKDLYEAAQMDGASSLRQFLRITLPLLTPVVLFNFVLQTIEAFKAFTPAFIISGGSGGPIDSTLFYTLYLYQQGFSFFKMGYASAMAWVLLTAIAIITTMTFALSKHWVHYEYEHK